jgi:hypothetical protein
MSLSFELNSGCSLKKGLLQFFGKDTKKGGKSQKKRVLFF